MMIIAEYKRPLLATGLCLALGVIVFGFVADIQNPIYLRLGFFLAALTTLATLWDMLDRKIGDVVRDEKIDALANDVRAIAASHKKQAELTVSLPRNATGKINSTAVELTVLYRELQSKYPPRGRQAGFDAIFSSFGPSPEQQRKFQIEHELWALRNQGIHRIQLLIFNGGERAAEGIDLFVYIPKILKPIVELPREPSEPQTLFVPAANLAGLRNVEIGDLDRDRVQLHWTMDDVNPNISRPLDEFYIEPGTANGEFLFEYAISTRNSGRFSGSIKLSVITKREIKKLPAV